MATTPITPTVEEPAVTEEPEKTEEELRLLNPIDPKTILKARARQPEFDQIVDIEELVNYGDTYTQLFQCWTNAVTRANVVYETLPAPAKIRAVLAIRCGTAQISTFVRVPLIYAAALSQEIFENKEHFRYLFWDMASSGLSQYR